VRGGGGFCLLHSPGASIEREGRDRGGGARAREMGVVLGLGGCDLGFVEKKSWFFFFFFWVELNSIPFKYY